MTITYIQSQGESNLVQVLERSWCAMWDIWNTYLTVQEWEGTEENLILRKFVIRQVHKITKISGKCSPSPVESSPGFLGANYYNSKFNLWGYASFWFHTSFFFKPILEVLKCDITTWNENGTMPPALTPELFMYCTLFQDDKYC